MHINSGRGGSRPGAGRHPSPDKRKSYTIRLSIAELATITERAKAEKLTVSEYIRIKALQ